MTVAFAGELAEITLIDKLLTDWKDEGRSKSLIFNLPAHYTADGWGRNRTRKRGKEWKAPNLMPNWKGNPLKNSDEIYGEISKHYLEQPKRIYTRREEFQKRRDEINAVLSERLEAIRKSPHEAHLAHPDISTS